MKICIKTFLLMMPIVVFSISPLHAKAENVWDFRWVGFTVGKSGCINETWDEYGYTWILRDKDYATHKKQLRNRLKNEYGKNSYGSKYYTRSFKSRSGRTMVHAIIKKTFPCTLWKGLNRTKMVSSYAFWYGKDKEDVIGKIERDRSFWMKLNGKTFSYEIAEWIDITKETKKLDMQGQSVVIGRDRGTS